jgi:hypothetical protein
MITVEIDAGVRPFAREARERIAPVVEAWRNLVRSALDLALALWRLVFPAVRCQACRFNSILVLHTCGKEDYLRAAVRRRHVVAVHEESGEGVVT